MSTRSRLLLIAIALLLLIAVLAVFLLSRVDARSRFEAMVSEVTGLQVVVSGGASIGLFPTPHVRLQEVVLSNGDSRIASLGEADIGVAFWPLLQKQVRIKRLVIRDVSVEVERDRNGRLSFEQPAPEKRLVPAMALGRLVLARATFRYTNRQSGNEVSASNCSVDSNNVQLAEGYASDIHEHLSLAAHVVCAEARNDRMVGANVDATVAGERGMFRLAPLTMQIMGGQGNGSIDADFAGGIGAYKVHYAIAQLHVDQLFRFLASGKVGEGMLDFSADLSMQGSDAAELTRTAQGAVTLRGKNLDMAIGNLDEKLAHYESSQNFNLVDVGAFFIAGPLGTAATKGRDFAGIFRGTNGNTEIRVLVSQWKVANGIAHAEDVAMATKQNRLAMKGGLDFVNQDFDEVTVAILDHQGCATVEQRIRGSFSKPEVQKPSVFTSLTGPISSLIGKATKMLGAQCQVFYEGSVPP